MTAQYAAIAAGFVLFTVGCAIVARHVALRRLGR